MTTKRPPLKLAAVACITFCVCAAASADLDEATETLLNATIGGEHRSVANKQRDAYRKPLETLSFLGLRSDMNVVEIWPGGGWYSEILAPILKDNGRFYAAQFSLNGRYGYQRRGLGDFMTKLGGAPDLYRDVIVTQFDLPYQLQIAPPESADMVLTFRNVHNLVMSIYDGGAYAELAFQAMFDALKPGGILGIVDHQWDDVANEDPLAENGYISKERTVAFAESVGFELVAESDLLRNPKDTKDHPGGVWTLPPTLALGNENREHYLAIGESDRFLLRFRKPSG
jgi:predicted methyltransferase